MALDSNGVSKPSNTIHNANTTSSSTQPSPNLSRRTSSIMGPPPVPQNSSLPNSPRPATGSMDNSAFIATTGPIRHPRPLTAAELHLELEKEQESIVNRLTRELSALRAQTASVASTTSSTSDLFTTTTSAQTDPYLYPYNVPPNTIPTSARRHRSSSNLSSRSARSTRDTLSNTTAVGHTTSVSGVAAPRERDRDHTHAHSHQNSSRPSIDIPRPEMSRQNSTSGGGGGSVYRTPSASSPHWTTSHPSYPYPRQSVSSTSQPPGGGVVDANVYTRSSPSASISGMTAAQAQARYEEAAIQRAELEAVKKENEALKTRIRELEKNLVERSTASADAGGGSGSEQRVLREQADGDGDGGAPIARS